MTPQSRDSREVTPQSEASGEVIRPVLDSVCNNSSLSEEQVPEEEKINQLPNSRPLKLLPTREFNPLNRVVDPSSIYVNQDAPSNDPEKVTCCCSLLQMIFGVSK